VLWLLGFFIEALPWVLGGMAIVLILAIAAHVLDWFELRRSPVLPPDPPVGPPTSPISRWWERQELRQREAAPPTAVREPLIPRDRPPVAPIEAPPPPPPPAPPKKPMFPRR